MLTHRTLYLHGMSVASLYKEPETLVDLHTIPLFHANGWGHPQSSTMLGVKQVMVRRFDPSFVLKLIEEHRVTNMCLVPTMANALLNSPDLPKYNHSSLRNIMMGGAASTPDLIRRMEAAFGCRCEAGYGLTETAPVITCGREKSTVLGISDEERIRRQAMAGWALPGVEVRVVDNDLRDVPRDGKSIGEIVVQGDHVMEGYF
jgi:fatty-acyl-CoA synthase